MAYDPPTIQPPDPSYALRTFRKALSARTYKPVDVFLLGDSLTEGYYASHASKRWSNLFRQGMQQTFNPQGVPGGEGYVPSCFSLGGMGAISGVPTQGSVYLPQRWSWAGSAIPSASGDFGFGIGRRSVYLNAITKFGGVAFYGDRCWLMYTVGSGAGWVGIGIDGKQAAITTVGALSGTGTGTFVVGDPEGWPAGSFTITVDDEDMTVSNGAGANFGTMTITARGINSTTAVAHATTNTPAMWAPAGVVRVNTYSAAPPRTSGRQWDSGPLTRGQHTLSVQPVNRAGGGATYGIFIDGMVAFDGDGAPNQATFVDGTPISSTVAAASNGVNVNTFAGAGTLNVASNANFPATGTVSVAVAGGVAMVSYTGLGSNTLTGCTVVAATLYTVAAGVMSTGGVVVSQHYDSATAKFAALDSGNQFRAPNLSGGNITVSSMVSATRVKLSVPPTAAGSAQTFSIGGRGAGVRVWEGGHAGYTSLAFTGPAGGANGFWADTLDVVDPDVVIVEFGVNDCNAAIGEAAFITSLTGIVTLINSKCLVSPSIVFMVPWLSTTFTVAQFQPYIDAIYKVANAVGAAVFDLNTHIPQQAPGDMLADGLHPTDLGSASIALELQKFLTGADTTDLPAPVTYDWSLALKNWRQAIGMVSVRPVDIAMVGDSITEGYYSATDDSRYIANIRKRLQAIYNPPGVTGGEGWIPMLHTVGGINGYSVAAPTGFVNLPQRWTFVNPSSALGSMTDGGYGLGRRAWFYSTGTTSKATITVVCDRFWILYTKYPTAASLNVYIDTVLQASQPSCVGSVIQSGYVWDSGPLTLGSHTIDVCASAAGGVIPEGIMVFNGDCGDITLTDGQVFTNTRLVSYKAYFQKRDIGKTVTSPGNTPIPAGTTIVGYVGPQEVTLSQATLATSSGNTFTIAGRGSGVRMWDGGRAGANTYYYAGPMESANGYWADPLENIDPDLVLIQLGPNDSNASTPGGYVDPSTYQANLISMVNLIRFKVPTTSIMFVSNWVSGLTTLQNWQPYRDAMFRVATQMGCGVIDLSMRMGPGPASGNTDLFADPLHLTDQGALVSANEHLWGLGLSDQKVPVVQSRADAPANPSLNDLWLDTASSSPTLDDLAFFNRDGALVVGAGVGRFRFPYGVTILGVTMAINTAPTGAAVICDVNKNGTTIFTTQANRPTIAVSGFATTSEPTPDVTGLSAGDYLTVDVDQIGSTVAGSDLSVFVRYRRT